MKQTTRDNAFKWTKFIAFVLLILGGLNLLLMGLFNFNLIGGIFGGGAVARIFYTLFGLGALVLLGVILAKVFSNAKEQHKKETRELDATK
ncbi:MAG: DUF378 domain-containing protein [Firmicutes bacterium]|nr:DUF378 domain-containing protein [Bacillota bacterium]